MLVARAFVFNADGRAVAAVLALALSVSYAALAGSATSAIRDPGEVVSEGFLDPPQLAHEPGFQAFDADDVEARTLLTNTTYQGQGWATITPWPFEDEPVRGPYAPQQPPAPDGVNVSELATVEPEHGSLAWAYLPPAAFEEAFPELAGQATQAYLAPGEPAPEGFASHPAKGSGRFYAMGAEQITSGVHALVLGMGLVAAVLSAGAIRLEVQARRSELATLEAMAGRGLVKRVIAQRATLLAVLGVALGLVGSIVGARLLGGLLEGLAIRPPTSLLLEVGLVGLAAGALAGTAAGWRDLRRPVAQRLGQRGIDARRFPGPVRFFLVTPRLWLGVLAAALVTTAIVAVLSGAAGAPSAVLGEDERTVVAGATGSNPFTGQTSRFLGENAEVLADVDQASPETFAPTVYAGEPVMVRGVDPDAWRSLTGAQLLEGRWPQEARQATLGAQLAARLDVDTGERVLVPAAHRNHLVPLDITGVHETPGPGNDALVTDLDTAGDMTGLAPSHVNIVRLQAPNPEAAEGLQTRFGIEVTDLAITPRNPVPDTHATAHVSLINLADEQRTRRLSVQADDDLVATRTVEVPASSRQTARIPFPVPDAPTLDVQVNPQRTVDTAPRSLSLQLPDQVPVDEPVTITVLDPEDDPVGQARVVAGGQTIGRTDARGQLEHAFQDTGRLTVSAEAGSATGGKRTFVMERAWTQRPHLRAEELSLGEPTAIDVDRARYAAQLTLTNLGAVAFEGSVEATAGNQTVGEATLSLDAHTSRTLAVEISVPLEAEAIHVAGSTFPIDAAEDEDEDEPVTLASLLASDPEDPGVDDEEADFLDRFFAQLDPVLLVVVLLTFAHAGLAVAFAVLREVRERLAIVDTLSHLGASREDVAVRATRDALLSLVIPVGLGIALAFLALELLAAQGWPAAFGHTLPADLSWGLAVRMAGGLLVVGAGVAALAASRTPSPASRRSEPVPLDRLVEGSR